MFEDLWDEHRLSCSSRSPPLLDLHQAAWPQNTSEFDLRLRDQTFPWHHGCRSVSLPFIATVPSLSLSLASGSFPKLNDQSQPFLRRDLMRRHLIWTWQWSPCTSTPANTGSTLKWACTLSTGNRGLLQARVGSGRFFSALGRVRASEPLYICNSLEGRSMQGVLLTEVLKNKTTKDPVTGSYHLERRQDSRSLEGTSFAFFQDACHVSPIVLEMPIFKHYVTLSDHLY